MFRLISRRMTSRTLSVPTAVCAGSLRLSGKRQKTMSETPLDRCLREQRECLEYIAVGGPDTRGAIQGLEDWIAAEILLRLEDEV